MAPVRELESLIHSFCVRLKIEQFSIRYCLCPSPRVARSRSNVRLKSNKNRRRNLLSQSKLHPGGSVSLPWIRTRCLDFDVSELDWLSWCAEKHERIRSSVRQRAWTAAKWFSPSVAAVNHHQSFNSTSRCIMGVFLLALPRHIERSPESCSSATLCSVVLFTNNITIKWLTWPPTSVVPIPTFWLRYDTCHKYLDTRYWTDTTAKI